MLYNGEERGAGQGLERDWSKTTTKNSLFCFETNNVLYKYEQFFQSCPSLDPSPPPFILTCGVC